MEDLWQQIEQAAGEVEGFFKDVSLAIEVLAEEVGKDWEDFTQEVEEIIVTEIEHCIEDAIDLIYESDLDTNISWEDFDNFVESEFMDITASKPSAENHPACVGCRHYHGKSYNGNLLVCAIHPYGCQDKTCVDWEDSPKSEI